MYSLQLLRPGSPDLLLLCHYSPTPRSAAASADSLAPTRLSPTCFHHRIPTCAPSEISDPSHISNSDHLGMYCATVLCHRRIYSYIVKHPAFSLSVAVEVYVHFPSGVLCGIRPVNRLSAWA